jgi:hypothetical protein
VRVVVNCHSMPMSDEGLIGYSVEMSPVDLHVLLTSDVVVLSRTMELAGSSIILELSVRSGCERNP